MQLTHCPSALLVLALAAGLSACGAQEETATTPPPAPTEPTSAAGPGTPATTGPTLALSFDGVPEPVKEAPLSVAPKGGFVLGMETAKAYLTVIGGPKAPLAVGTYAIRDTVGSAVSAYGLTGTSSITYQGRLRPLHSLKSHRVQGSFKHVPFGDPQKSIEDLQKALKSLPH